MNTRTETINGCVYCAYCGKELMNSNYRIQPEPPTICNCERAKEELDLGEVEGNVREVIITKIYESLLYNTPWELMGETYCCRTLFYAYRKQFCYLVALHLGIVEESKN